MIREVSGDILLSKADVIAHGVAPSEEMTVGLAASMNQTFPGLADAFKEYCKALHPMPGDAWTWNGPGKRVICLFTQQQALTKGGKPGPANLDAVKHTLYNLKKHLRKVKARSCALSKVATGAGGLPWAEVKTLVASELADVEIPIFLYADYQRGIPAAE